MRLTATGTNDAVDYLLPDQTDEEIITYEVSDEALEAAVTDGRVRMTNRYTEYLLARRMFLSVKLLSFGCISQV
jgi:hypothetical protein